MSRRSITEEMMTPGETQSADYRRKILPAARLRAMIESARKAHEGANRSESRGPVVVQCHGCFDIVHPGHIRYLQYARSQGDCLIVSITGDAAIHKGDLRPYIPEELRAENLAALEFVDYVVIDPNPTASELLATLRPDVYVKGQEYATSRDPRFLDEKRVVESYGGRILFSSGQVVFSSTRLGESLTAEQIESHRLGALCARHGINHPHLCEIVDRFHGLRVLVIGDVYLDRYVLCDSGAVAGESPMMSLSELDRRDYLGGAALIAAQAAALGAKPLLMTSVGDDPDSRRIVAELEKLGVRVVEIARRTEMPLRTRFLVDDHKIFKVDRGGPCPLDSVAQRRAFEILLHEAPNFEAAILHDAGYGVLTPSMLQQAGPSLRERVPFLCGGSSELLGNLAAYRDLDLIGTSERRLRSELSDPGAGLSTLTYRMMERTQATRMLVTVGKRGVVTFDRHTHDRSTPQWRDRLLSEYLPSMADRVVDRLGCGETSLAISGMAMAVGASLMQAAYLGQALTAIQIASVGPTPVEADALRRLLHARVELAQSSECETVNVGSTHTPESRITIGAPGRFPVSTPHEQLRV